ncbi:MAG: hypothetical protein ACD_4C00243G0004 [uncultured bacterium (gcode 4)]|uniref:Uncharacterized protein n=1 Tax=uncultured bacterium (gcode 4) TaxID=1234023 RepID=K2GT66_9BACT|nr:MAG: hypothetical protein ACD_4C00243G0004 [uncultured bacterium (gcode 4)]
MKLLIVAATSNELNIVKEKIKSLKKNINISYLVCWIWSYEAIFSLSRNIENEKPDFVFNIWICWYTSEGLDYIQIWRIFNEQTWKELIVPAFINFWNIRSISSCEKIIYDPIEIQEKFVDMESFWIEFVCSKYKIPRLLIKVPADKIWIETRKFDYKNALEKLEKNLDYEKILNVIIEYILKIPLDIDYSYIKNHFRFTFQEFEIFKNMISKYETLSWKKIEDFFEESRNLSKKDFLKFLK